MSPTTKEIKRELSARIDVCNSMREGGYVSQDMQRRLRRKIITLRSVLSWINGQEQLGCQCGPVPCTNKQHNERTQ